MDQSYSPLAIVFTIVLGLMGCGDASDATEGGVIVRTVPPVDVPTIASRVVCGPDEAVVAEGELQIVGADPLTSAPVWAELIEGLPAGECTALLSAESPEGDFSCAGEESFTTMLGGLTELDVLLICTLTEDTD
ncbi:MAG: hypothetical protein WBG86_22680 [Polyangiales bacterium]